MQWKSRVSVFTLYYNSRDIFGGMWASPPICGVDCGPVIGDAIPRTIRPFPKAKRNVPRFLLPHIRHRTVHQPFGILAFCHSHCVFFPLIQPFPCSYHGAFKRVCFLSHVLVPLSNSLGRKCPIGTMVTCSPQPVKSHFITHWFAPFQQREERLENWRLVPKAPPMFDGHIHHIQPQMQSTARLLLP